MPAQQSGHYARHYLFSFRSFLLLAAPHAGLDVEPQRLRGPRAGGPGVAAAPQGGARTPTV